MKFFAMTLNLKNDPGTIEKYKKYHRAVWTEVTEGLRNIGISKTKIFLHGRRLFMYIEAHDDFDLARDFPRYMENNRAREWDRLMRTFQEPLPDAAPGDWWTPMEEIFNLELE